MVLVTTPKLPLFEEQQVPFGGPNCGRLKISKNSARNSRLSLPSGPKYVRLNRAKSQLLMPSCRRVGSTRASLPKDQGPGAAKHEVLNHPFRLCGPAPEAAPLL